LIYYFVAYYGDRPRSAAEAIRLVEKNARLAASIGADLNRLRIMRNRIAHARDHITSAEDAAAYASEALNLIGLIGECVPDDLALSSGAARIA